MDVEDETSADGVIGRQRLQILKIPKALADCSEGGEKIEVRCVTQTERVHRRDSNLVAGNAPRLFSVDQQICRTAALGIFPHIIG